MGVPTQEAKMRGTRVLYVDDWVGDPGEGREWSSVGVEAKEVMGREVDDKRTDGAEADE